MDGLRFFLLRYERLHGRDTDQLLSGLADEDVRRSPLPGVNSIAWLLWHMTRCEDIRVNRFVANRPQVLLEEEWPSRLNVSLRDIGTGMADDEVTDFSARVNLSELRAYRAAVGRRTLEVVHDLRPQDLDEVIDPNHVRRVIEDGALGENAGWVEELWRDKTVEELWRDKTRGWYLAQLALTHNHAHFGEAFVVRGLMGLRRR